MFLFIFHLYLGVVRIPFSKSFNNEFKLGTAHSNPCKSKDLLFSATTAKSLIIPPKIDGELAYKESCTFDGEQSCEQDIEEDHGELQHDLRSENYAYESPIERWFQASTRLEKFSISFFLVNS